MKVKLILGSAGCGKTTYLLDQVDEFIKSGIAPNQIAYLSFTKKAADEAVERACKKFNLTKDKFPYFRTIHSLAYSFGQFKKNEIMDHRNWAEFSKDFGYELNTGVLLNESPTYLGHGDMCLIIYSLSKVKKQTVQETWEEKAYEDLPYDTALLFAERLEKYKSQRGVYDYCDFMDNAKTSINPKILIVDEAQDLTRQQWEFVRTHCRPTDQVLIAGDDDQAIYEWGGADLETFMGFAAEKVVLPYTYRLPKLIFELSQKLVTRISNRFDKNITCRDEPGTIQWMATLNELPIEKGEWLMMARNKSRLKHYEELCRSVGVVYLIDHKWSNEIDEIKAIILYEGLRAGKELTVSEANKVIAFVRDMQPVKKETIKYKYEDLKWPHEGKPDWMLALNDISAEMSSYIRELRRNGEPLTGPGRIKISTIHASKGGEADNVVLDAGIGKRTMRLAHKDAKTMDAELRVWFVAVTRTRQNLYLHGDENIFI